MLPMFRRIDIYVNRPNKYKWKPEIWGESQAFLF